MNAYLASSIALATLVAAAPNLSAELARSPQDLGGPTATVGFDTPSQSGITSATEWRLTERYSVRLTPQGGPASVGVAHAGAWSLGSNGDWAGAKTFAGVDAGALTDGSVAGMTFDVVGPSVSGIGGLFNYVPDITYAGGFPHPFYLAAYGASGNLLEEHELPLFTPGALNAGDFYGIVRAASDISRLEVRGPYAVVDDLVMVVPEPSVGLLAFAGAVFLGMSARRRV